MPTNDFLQFCPTDTGTNLLTEADYTASADRTSGNKPGIASAKLNNRALRQANYVTSQVAQFVSDSSATDVLDDATPTKLLAQINSVLKPLPPTVTSYLSGSGTHGLTYYFFIVSGNATAAATYTNNAVTFTVKATVAAGVQVAMSGAGTPLASGTLTKTGGTGDATLTFYAVRAPLFLNVKMVGAGGGGGGSGTAAGTNGGTGGNSTFGTTLLVANGGVGGVAIAGVPGTGGTASLGSGPLGIALAGSNAAAGLLTTNANVSGIGGSGGPSALGGAGYGGGSGQAGGAGVTNSGAGGGGGGGSGAVSGGSGGGSGGYVEASISSPAVSYAYAVGAAGAAGTAGTSGTVGAAGGASALPATPTKYLKVVDSAGTTLVIPAYAAS